MVYNGGPVGKLSYIPAGISLQLGFAVSILVDDDDHDGPEAIVARSAI
jgi:hypothetical protein